MVNIAKNFRLSFLNLTIKKTICNCETLFIFILINSKKIQLTKQSRGTLEGVIKKSISKFLTKSTITFTNKNKYFNVSQLMKGLVVKCLIIYAKFRKSFNCLILLSREEFFRGCKIFLITPFLRIPILFQFYQFELRNHL